MADSNSRSYGSRGLAARDEFDPTAHETAGDPLAELARLIGQSDPYADGSRHERHGQLPSRDDMPPSGLDWRTGDDYAEHDDRAEDRYVAPPDLSHPDVSHPGLPHSDFEPQYGGHEDEPLPSAHFFSGRAARFNGFGDEGAASRADYAADSHQPHQPHEPPVSPAGHTQAYVPPSYDGYDEAGEPLNDGDQDYPSQDYEDDTRQSRRSGLVVVMAVLALAVLGTAGAFGYRAMFGGSMLSSLPPIIKASNGPNKIMPSYSDAQARSPAQTGAPGEGQAEQLAPPAEQPVDIQQPVKIAPRVISTIPIVPGSSPAPPGAQMPAQMSAGLPASPAPAAPAQFAAAPAAPAPVIPPPPAPPPAFAPAVAPSSAPMAAPVQPATPAPPVSSEPKKVHTVTIHADQQGARSAAAAAPSAAHKPSAPAQTPARVNEPLSIVPGAGGDLPAAAQAYARTATHPMVVASAAPAGGTASPGGGYAVQVTSQRSEAEAQAAFRALKAKYPDQLGGREPVIHRADLGAKGIYYRALVGPFASAEAAAEMCSSLKAAGGNCLVQRN